MEERGEIDAFDDGAEGGNAVEKLHNGVQIADGTSVNDAHWAFCRITREHPVERGNSRLQANPEITLNSNSLKRAAVGLTVSRLRGGFAVYNYARYTSNGPFWSLGG